MNNPKASRPDGTRVRSVVVSKPGAALHVEKIALTGELKAGLTTKLNSLGGPRSGKHASKRA